MRMKRKDTQRLLSQQKTKPSKAKSTMVVMGLMVAAVSVFVGTSGVANAQAGNTSTGYGGGISIDIGDVIGDNNVIVIIVNYFVGNS
jgi:hypothetical protein